MIDTNYLKPLEKRNQIFGVSLLILLISHFVLGQNGRNLSYSLFVICTLGLILNWFYIFSKNRKNDFFLLLIFYICSHFTIFLKGGGGLFNLVAATFIPAILFSKRATLKKKNFTDSFLIIALIIINFLGYVAGDLKLYFILNGLVAFIGIMVIFYFARATIITPNRIKLIILCSSILAIVNFFITANSSFQFIEVQSPFFLSNYEIKEYQKIANTGFHSAVELFGEWSMLVSFLLLPFIVFRDRNMIFSKTEEIILIVGYFLSLISALISFSKSVFILLIVGTILQLVFMGILNKNNFKVVKSTVGLGLIFLLTLPLLVNYFSLTHIFERIVENPKFLENFINNPLTGQGTSREEVYNFGLERLSQKTWLLGNGWSIAEGNYYSWFGRYRFIAPFADFHNLYFSLIPIIGYFGLSILLALFFRAITNLVVLTWRCRNISHPILPISIGLIFVLFFFLIDEYKINATRDSYFSIMFIWLGLSMAISSNFKKVISGH